MSTNLLRNYFVQFWSRIWYVLLFATLGVLIVSVWLDKISISEPSRQEVINKPELTATSSVSFPKYLHIPKINLTATFVPPLGLNSDRTVEVPDVYDMVGWYKYGVVPGEIGTAVILGHVDSFTGPAIFYNLKDLEVGDQIEVERDDGTKVIFVVNELVSYGQNNFPTQQVYGDTNTPQLRLVTCSGIYSRITRRYSHNLVVYASVHPAID